MEKVQHFLPAVSTDDITKVGPFHPFPVLVDPHQVDLVVLHSCWFCLLLFSCISAAKFVCSYVSEVGVLLLLCINNM